MSHEPEQEPLFSCSINSHSHLPVYTNIHRIRRDVVSIVEDYMSLEQLRDLRINLSVIRPLVDQLYGLDDISIGRSPWKCDAFFECPGTTLYLLSFSSFN